MASVIDALVVTLGLDSSKFQSGSKQASVDLKKTREEATTAAKEIEASGKKAAEFFTKLRNEAIALAAVFVGYTGLKAFVSDVVAGDAATGRLAANLNITTEALTAWEGAAERAGGSSAGLAGSLQSMTAAVEQFKLTGQSPMIPFLRRLGVTDMKELDDLPKFLLAHADQFKAMSAPEASAIGQGLGIDQGTINLLRMGRAEIQRLLDAQIKLGVVHKADTDSAIALSNSMKDIEQAATSLGRTILTELSPDIQGVLKDMDGWLKANGEWLKTQIVEKIRDFRDYLKSIDWTGIREGLTTFVAKVNELVTALGGWQRVGEAIFALWAISKLSAIAGGMAGIGAALSNPVVLAALAAWGVYYTAHARFAADTQEQYDATMKSWAPNSPFWKDIPEETQKEFSNSPFYQQAEPGILDRMRQMFGGTQTATPTTAQQGALSQQAMDYFTAQGWTREQAAGIIGNLQQESGFNAGAKNASGHVGIAQWSPERQADIAQHFGKPVSAMSYAEQLAAVQWELTEGKYKNVGKALKQATTEGQSSTVIDHGYEIPANTGTPELAREDARRAANATQALAMARPRPLAAPAPTTTAQNDNSSETHIGQITIHTQAEDGAGIAKDIGPALKRYGFATQANSGLM